MKRKCPVCNLVVGVYQGAMLEDHLFFHSHTPPGCNAPCSGTGKAAGSVHATPLPTESPPSFADGAIQDYEA